MYTIKKIFREVHDEYTAVKFLQENELLPRIKVCSQNHEMVLYFDNRIYWKCNKRSCRKNISLRTDSWFEGSKLQFENAVLFIYSWCEELTSIKYCSKHLGMSQPTTVDWNNYLREVCVWKMNKTQVCIGGDNKFVEIDESLFSKRKYNVGRVFPQQWVFGGICRETNECFLELVKDRSESTLLEVIKRRIHHGSTVLSDCWKGYKNLYKYVYKHQTVNHRYNFVDPKTLSNTQKIERLWGSAKWGNKRRRGTNRNFLASYLAEFMWRTQIKEKDAFSQILVDIKEFWLEMNNK